VTTSARITFVVAVAENGVIGRNGELPWRLPTDLKRFRKLTLGKPVIMGRKTYESIGKPLDGRHTIVVTRQPGYAPAGVHVVASVEDAIALGHRLAAERGADEVAVIGGAAIFAAVLARADRVFLTRVHGAPDGDVHFPALDARHWVEVVREPMPQGPNDQFPADFIVLDRRG